jgi:hypothetical protein
MKPIISGWFLPGGDNQNAPGRKKTQRYSKPILGLSAIRSEEFAALLHDY